MSSSIPSWQTLTAHAQPFRGARDLAFCLNVPLDSLLVWASSEGFGETARMRRLAWTFAARIGDKYQIRLARPICLWSNIIEAASNWSLKTYTKVKLAKRSTNKFIPFAYLNSINFHFALNKATPTHLYNHVIHAFTDVGRGITCIKFKKYRNSYKRIVLWWP